MAYRVLQFTATIPAGTTMDTPENVPLDLDGWDIEYVDLEVPPGPAGLMGFYLANNGQPWVPFTPGQHIRWDGDRDRYPATNWPSAGGWEVIGYNLDVFDHDVIARFGVNPTVAAIAAASQIAFGFVQSGVVHVETVLP